MLLRQKIKPPVNRPNAVEKLVPPAMGSNYFPLCVIAQPFGSGKTVFASRYAGEYGAHVLWYSLDAMDNQESVFLEYIEYLFAQAAGQCTPRDTAVYREIRPSISPPERLRFLLGRLTEILSAVGERYCLVLDSFEHITGRGVRAMVAQLVKYRPDRLSVVLITNREIPGFLFRSIMNRECMVLGREALFWTREETCVFVNRELPGVCGEQADWVYGQTEGWPAGVIFLTEYLKRRGGQQGFGEESPDWDEIFLSTYFGDYLEEEITARKLEPEIWDFIVSSAVPTSFTKESGMAALEDDRFVEHLQCIFRGNLFLQYREGVYHYIPFFREYLNRKCQMERKREILSRLFSHHVKKREYIRAVSCGLEGGLTEELAGLLGLCGQELLGEERLELLGEMLDFLEGREVELDLRNLEIAAQYAFASGRYSRMESYLNQGDIQFGKENKFSVYRSLYKALLHLEEDRERYATQINNALFFLRENNLEIPYLRERDQRVLRELEAQYRDREQKEGARLLAYTFGTFRILFPDSKKPLSWRTKKGRELFAYLMEMRGKPVERKQLIRTLWPEEMPDHAVAMLHNMIYNIRKELSAYHLEGLIRYQDKKYSLPMEVIQQEFPDLEEICRLVESGDVGKLYGKEGRFTSYWGRYLEDIDNQWAEELGNYYDRIYAMGCRMLGDGYFEEEKYERAEIFYRNAALLNPYSEELEEKRLECFKGIGDVRQMKRQYEAFEKICIRDLDVPPSSELEAVYWKCSREAGKAQ